MRDPVLLINHADVVDRDSRIVGTSMAIMDVTADHQFRTNPVNGRQQLAAAKVLDPP
jgi:hypothetical protein